MNDSIESASGDGRGLEGGWLTKTRRTINLYNVYGIMITKNNKGCSHYYELININSNTAGLKLDNKFSEMNVGWQYEK